MNSINFVDVEGIKRLISESHKSIASTSEAIKELANLNLDSMVKSLAESQVFYNKFLERGEFKKIFESATRNRPYNFANLRISSQIDLIEISYNCIFGTFDSIPENVITSLLDVGVSLEGIDDILLSNSKEIVEFITNSINEIHIHEGREYSFFNMLLKSIKAFEDGHFEASQSLSTVIWDSYLSNHFRLKRRNGGIATEVKRDAPAFDINKANDFETLYARVAYGPIIASYIESNQSTKYSRNGTVHNANSQTLNNLNAIKSLTIAAGMLQYSWRKGDLYSIEIQ
jgi:hypothetical protein